MGVIGGTKGRKWADFVGFFKIMAIFVAPNPVPWMSGLVSGLQNRLRRFESARHLTKTRAANGRSCLYFCEVPVAPLRFAVRDGDSILLFTY